MYRLFFSDFKQASVFSKHFSKNTHISNFMKIRPMGDELFHADGQTDRHDEDYFRDFAKASNNVDYVCNTGTKTG
jgi:hypothetical protein